MPASSCAAYGSIVACEQQLGQVYGTKTGDVKEGVRGTVPA